MLVSFEDAEDTVQETFLRAWQRVAGQGSQSTRRFDVEAAGYPAAMSRFVDPGRNGWLALLGGLVLGVSLALVFFRVATFDESWMALAVGALPSLAAIPYRPNRPAPLAPWRYFVLTLGIALIAASLLAWLA